MTDSRPTLSFERIGKVLDRRGCGRSNFYAEIAAGLWPPPIHVGRASLWASHETDAMLAAHIAGATDDQLRQLVRELLELRKGLMPQVGSQAA